MRRAAAERGNHEAVTWSFLPTPEADAFALRQAQDDRSPVWTLANPISEDMKAMRPSLLPGLLSAVRRNLDRGAAGLRLFEIGRRYLRGDGGVSDERLSLAFVLAGEKTPRGWKVRPEAAYVHYCSNETIGGVEFHWVPDAGAVPLVADASSHFLSRPLDVSKFGLIYAGAQKNAGPAGLTKIRVISVTREAGPNSSFINVKALCNAGEIVISGGFAVSGGAQATSRVVENSPFDVEEGRAGWTSTAVFESGYGKKAASVTLTTYAVCAQLSER